MSSDLSQELSRAQHVEEQLHKIGGVAFSNQAPSTKEPHSISIVASDSHRQGGNANKIIRHQHKKHQQKPEPDARRSFRTFGLEKCREIDRNNLLLVKNLAAINLRRQPVFGPDPKTKIKKEGGGGKSSLSMNRRKTGDRIARENLAFAERLARIQGTRELSSDVMRKEAKLQRKYVKQCRRKKNNELELWRS